MDALREMAMIVHQSRGRSPEMLGSNDSSTSKLSAFFSGLVDGQIQTDEEAANRLYNAGKNTSKYQKLKFILKKRLISQLFLIDHEEAVYNDRQKAYYECYKEWAATKILLGKNANTAAAALSEKVLKQARRFEFTDLVLDISRLLRSYYGSWEGNIRKYEFYNQLFKETATLWQIENYAEELYTELITRYVNNKTTKVELHQKACASIAKLEDDLRSFDSYRLHLCGSLIRIFIASSINDYDQLIQTCRESIAFFEQKNYSADVPIQIAYQQLLVCYTQLKKYEEGKEAAEKCLSLIEEGAFNWFKYQEFYLLLALHTKNYQDAYHLYNL